MSLNRIAIVALLALVSCGGPPPAAGPPAGSVPPTGSSTTTAAASAKPAAPERSQAARQLTTIRVALAVPNSPLQAPLFLAQEKGFFEPHGVKPDVTPYNGGGPMQQALAAGSADAIHPFPPAMALANSKGVKQHIVAVDQPYAAGWAILVGKDSPIKTLADLNGKKIGITSAGSTTDIYARWAMLQGKAQATLVPVGGQGVIPNLISGQVDAGVAPPPDSFKGVAQGMRVLVDLGKTMPPILQDMVVVSDSYIAAHPEGVRGYLQGIFQGVAYLKTHRDEAIQFLIKLTQQPVDIETKEYEEEIMQMSDDGTWKPEWLEGALKIGEQAGLTGLPPASELVNTQFVPVKL
jgi:NitT/TauT family transport system substrate-binding protein